MRLRPYTARGIRRVPCLRCGEPSTQQWQICADHNQYRGICTDCDIELNQLVLTFMGFPEDVVDDMMRRYKEKIGA